MNWRTWRWTAAAIGLGVAVAVPGAGGLAQTPAAAEPLRVVATFSVLGDLVDRVGGDAIDLRTIVAAGADAHTFEPAPDDAIALGEADLVFANGIGFEPWLDELAEGADEPLPIVVVTDGIELREAGDAPHPDEGDVGPPAEGETHADAAASDHDRGAFDPHVWHDVRNAMAMTEAIRDALIAADPANADLYQANAATLLAELETLDAWVVEQVATLPEDRRKLVTSHDTFGYFADRYGFEVVGTALDSASTEGGGPSAREIAELVERIEAAGVPAIFAENVQNPEVMEAVAEEAGVSLAPPLSTDALGAPGSGADSYEGMVRSNVETIVAALGG